MLESSAKLASLSLCPVSPCIFQLSLVHSRRLLFSTLMKFSYSLSLSWLALAATALPVESTELLVLTPDNFDETISQGVWYAAWYYLRIMSSHIVTGLSNTSLLTADIVRNLPRHGIGFSRRISEPQTLAYTWLKSTALSMAVNCILFMTCDILIMGPYRSVFSKSSRRISSDELIS